MALTYMPKYQGYITDVPKVWFKRKADKKLFHFDQLSEFSSTPNVQYNEVNAK